MVKPKGGVEYHGPGPADPAIVPDEHLVVVWYADKRQRRPVQVHLVLRWKGLPTEMVFRFKGPDTLGFLIEEMARQRALIWPKAGAMPAVPPAGPGQGSGRKKKGDAYAKQPPGYHGLGMGDMIFGELKSTAVTSWCPNDTGENPTELHLRFQAADGSWLALPLTSADQARVFIKKLIACRRYVWPRAERVTVV